jgi:hypothetical protein
MNLDETLTRKESETMEITQPLLDLAIVLAFFAAALLPKAISFYFADREHK